MKRIFADTCYWIAILNPKDDLHNKAIQVSKDLNPFMSITSEMVLTELLNSFASKGENLRKTAAKTVEQVKSASNCEIVPQTSILFREALGRYENRLDKSWSLTDCASFLIMEEWKLIDALTYDEHFFQAGFNVLLRNPV